MARNFNFGGIKLAGLSIKDPRVAMRAVIGVLLAANVAAAVIAFKPFGGSAADLRQEQSALSSQLAELQKRSAAAKRLVDKVEMARREGDDFLAKYVVDRRAMASTLAEELYRMAKDAGVRALPGQLQLEPIEGSDTLEMASIEVGYEGTYEGLKKFVDMVDKSPRFLIVESMTVLSPQQQQKGTNQVVTVTLKLDTFVRETGGAAQ